MEYNDIYDRRRKLTGRTHLRGTPWGAGEYGLVVCVWVYDGEGKLLLTKRAKEKSFPGTWENSGGAVRAGERSRQAIARELFEETGIRADEQEFELLDSGCDGRFHYDYYCLKRNTPLSEIVLLPGETDDVQWVTFEQVHEMIEQKKICRVIARQFKKQESMLLSRQNAQNKA
ncbi:MAG: NUDIX domain-containing protein [Oscillospiraceae bacterium]|nr:NUDIX domain-containing protein [Oscillospiraceae bacterium]